MPKRNSCNCFVRPSMSIFAASVTIGSSGFGRTASAAETKQEKPVSKSDKRMRFFICFCPNRSRAGGAGHSDLAGFPSPHPSPQRCRLE